ncbi:GAF domain-containing protein [Streptomyces sp. NPDC058001]|uniref:GAF domain-containing protein n=1 Tax=Streptomyces sp. NPDC058001 TaxID=3346300 RepID=UPI0036ECCC27
MRYEPRARPAHGLLTPVDREAPERVRRLRALGLGAGPDLVFDAFADRLVEVTGSPYGIVNFIGEKRQFLAGLRTPQGRSGVPLGAVPAVDGGPDRCLARDRGYCPHVVVRHKALVLEDVRDYPRFAGNPLVDESGVRSYLGAPLIDRTGIALGTVCVLDTEPRPWGRPGLETIKTMAAELVEEIHRREDGLL